MWPPVPPAAMTSRGALSGPALRNAARLRRPDSRSQQPRAAPAWRWRAALRRAKARRTRRGEAGAARADARAGMRALIARPDPHRAPPEDVVDLVLRPLAGQRQQHAEAERAGDQRRPAVGDQRQRHALGRQHPHRDADVDQRLQPEPDREPGAGEPDERIALAHQPEQRAHDDRHVERHDDDAEDQPELLGGDRDDEVGVRVRQRPLHRAVADADPEKAALLDRAGRIADLGARIDLGREEAVDAPRDVLGVVVGEPADRRSPRRRRRRAASPPRRRRSTSAPRWR